jgi:hypothetical protein
MRKGLFALALGLSMVAPGAAADVLTMPEGEDKPTIVLPAKGQTMADVQAKYGPPRVKQPSVGGDRPQHPPITRWDYDGFSVIFEHDRVINAVVPGAPPKLQRRDRLQTLPALTPLPESATPPAAAPLDPVTPEPATAADADDEDPETSEEALDADDEPVDDELPVY